MRLLLFDLSSFGKSTPTMEVVSSSISITVPLAFPSQSTNYRAGHPPLAYNAHRTRRDAPHGKPRAVSLVSSLSAELALPPVWL
jgi:hypothetical protein